MSQNPAATQPLMSRKSGALQGAVSVPGDKSISHRALLLGALAEGRTEITGLLELDDVLGTARALQESRRPHREDKRRLDCHRQGSWRADNPEGRSRFRKFRYRRAPDDGRRRRPSGSGRVHRRRLLAQKADGARPRSLEEHGARNQGGRPQHAAPDADWDFRISCPSSTGFPFPRRR